ncbi:hypothetical protein [Nocardia jiangxiensis]|uniref:hypothetical protein n=1 Tax=Nocardia jiangxiensis TaxID=282685 RepID=UPI0012F6DD76|nr:hypothetical protein [Nocardia jiangxiensis]
MEIDDAHAEDIERARILVIADHGCDIPSAEYAIEEPATGISGDIVDRGGHHNELIASAMFACHGRRVSERMRPGGQACGEIGDSSIHRFHPVEQTMIVTAGALCRFECGVAPDTVSSTVSKSGSAV